MKTILFDAGPIISLTMNNLLWVLPELKNSKLKFYITSAVKHEIVDRPLETRRFKFEALQVQRLLDNKTIDVIDDEEVISLAKLLQNLANSILSAHNQPIALLQRGELETLAAAILYKADALVIDERVTRTLIENPSELKKLMERRLHQRLNLNKSALDEFTQRTRHLRIIRSIELATCAFEQGILDSYIVKLPNAKRELLESVLWGLKMNGASVAEQEINEIVKIQKLN